MGWVKIDDRFFSHPKVIDLTPPAKLLYLGGLAHCAANLTNGFISPGALRSIAAMTGVAAGGSKQLVKVGLWHEDDGGWRVHDYLEYQPSADEERRRRDEAKERTAAWRERRRRDREEQARDGDVTRHADVTNDIRDASGDAPVTEPRTRTRTRPSETSLAVTSRLPTGAGIGEGNPLANAQRAAGEILDEAHRRAGSAPLTANDRKRLRPLIVDDWLPAGHPPDRIAQAIADANARTDKGVGFMLNQLARPSSVSGGRTPPDPMAGLRAAAAKGRS